MTGARLRTIVGSGPARKPLPYGREAVERAIKHCEFWGTNRPDHASGSAWGNVCLFDDMHGHPGRSPSWLPARLQGQTVYALAELRRGMPPRAER